MTTTLTPTLDQAKVEQFTHKVIGDLGRGALVTLPRAPEGA